jgi:hypothetical protein
MPQPQPDDLVREAFGLNLLLLELREAGVVRRPVRLFRRLHRVRERLAGALRRLYREAER